MPDVVFENRDHETVAVVIVGNGPTKNFTLKRGSPPERVRTLAPFVYAWWPKNETIKNDEVSQFGVEVTRDQEIVFGDPDGRVWA